MTSPPPFHEIPGVSRAETLTEILARGPLSLASALQCGSEVARLLHELHVDGRAHGKLTTSSVLLRPSGMELLPARNLSEPGGVEDDVRAFGALLYEMLTSSKVPANASEADFDLPDATSEPAGVQSAAIRVAGKCLGYVPAKLTMQQAATEIQLLWVVSRQLEAEGAEQSPEPIPAAATEPVEQAPPAIPEEAASPAVPLAAAHFSKPASKPLPLEPAGVKCPKCDSAVVYKSRARSSFEMRLVGWNFPMCRCHRCYHRFIVVAGMRIGKEMPAGRQRPYKPKGRH